MSKKGIAVAGNMIVDMLYPTYGMPKPGELVTVSGDVDKSTGGCLCNDIVDLAKLDPTMPLVAVGRTGDDETGKYIMEKLRERIDTTFIYVTHDQTEAMTLGDRIVIMKDGFIQQIGTPQEVFNHPYNLFVAGFIGTPQMNFFDDAHLIKENGKYAVKLGSMTVELSDEKQEKLAANNVEPQEIILGVRPEHIELAKVGIDGTIDVSEMMGSSVHLHVSALGQDVVLVVSTMNMTGAEVAALANGNPVTFNFAGHVCHVFNKETGINLEA